MRQDARGELDRRGRRPGRGGCWCDGVCDVIRRTSDGAFDFNSFEPVKTKIGFAGLVSRAGFPRGYSALHKVG